MASPVLHIKDAYYFEVPRGLWRADFRGKAEFPNVWVRLDPEFQEWQGERLHGRLAALTEVPAWPELREVYLAWRDEPGNFAKPLHRMLEEDQASHAWFGSWLAKDGPASQWREMRSLAGDVAEYKQSGDEWSSQKIAAYNERLSGKVLIPQPPGVELRNLYESETFFSVSKFLVLQLLVALVMLFVFTWLGRKIVAGGPPKGRLWNLLEVILVYLRDHVARPAIGSHDGDHFVPLLWTVFMFVLFCNLCGLIPWFGTPTGSFGVTAGLAGVTFLTGTVIGMRRFGIAGFFLNQVPSMSLPLVMAIVIKPLLLVLELVGFCIKHAVLALRLLANMVAGHMVLLGILGLAFGASGALLFEGQPTWLWGGTAVVSVVASALFSCLELFVAFLQAYIFTFLSALFIGAAIHHH
jgi:F-type H+-transporting ATPase subunit a